MGETWVVNAGLWFFTVDGREIDSAVAVFVAAQELFKASAGGELLTSSLGHVLGTGRNDAGRTSSRLR
jgi:hypothetical protein